MIKNKFISVSSPNYESTIVRSMLMHILVAFSVGTNKIQCHYTIYMLRHLCLAQTTHIHYHSNRNKLFFGQLYRTVLDVGLSSKRFHLFHRIIAEDFQLIASFLLVQQNGTKFDHRSRCFLCHNLHQ